MAIVYEPEQQVFRLDAGEMSYAMQVLRGGILAHLYCGSRLDDTHIGYLLRGRKRGFAANPLEANGDRGFTLDTLPQEYAGFGVGDFRTAAVKASQADGSTTTDLRYVSHRILDGAPDLRPLPHVFLRETHAKDAAQTLLITLRDDTTGLEADLQYVVFEAHSLVVRSACLRNTANIPMLLEHALSLCMDFSTADYDWITLYGRHESECNIQRTPLHHGIQSIGSLRGHSSPHYNPFMALAQPCATEEQGEVFGVALVYSGNFLAQAEVDQTNSTRLLLGLHPTDFCWQLQPQQSFQTPQAVLAFSSSGLGGMSRTFHRFFAQHLITDVAKPRPILINNWEATEWNFTTQKVLEIAQTAAKLGVELFVLDDGWFGKREDITSGLGDWMVNTQKMMGGLTSLVQQINALGMRFGLWFEPEMVSVDSDLYRAHPDWCLHDSDRYQTPSRGQLVLDLSRSEVVDYLFDAMSAVLESANITYLKWDYNRSMTNVHSAAQYPQQQRETWHRCVLGMYTLYARLRERFPHILFEGCASGGGRFDAGMLYFAPQHWTSDDTDPAERVKIQYGCSMVYPLSCMSAHVSVSPNQQTHRATPFETRGLVAYTGAFGYELDATCLRAEEQACMRRQIAEYKALQPLLQTGDLYRLRNPFTENACCQCVAAPDRSLLFLSYVQLRSIPNPPLLRQRIPCADAAKTYRDTATGACYTGLVLRHVGINLPELYGDHACWFMLLEDVTLPTKKEGVCDAF